MKKFVKPTLAILAILLIGGVYFFGFTLNGKDLKTRILHGNTPLDTYSYCGCGKCPATPNPEIKKLYKHKGANLDAARGAIAEAESIDQCQAVGCQPCVEYVLYP